jgi:hypothetical protein
MNDIVILEATHDMGDSIRSANITKLVTQPFTFEAPATRPASTNSIAVGNTAVA